MMEQQLIEKNLVRNISFVWTELADLGVGMSPYTEKFTTFENDGWYEDYPAGTLTQIKPPKNLQLVLFQDDEGLTPALVDKRKKVHYEFIVRRVATPDLPRPPTPPDSPFDKVHGESAA